MTHRMRASSSLNVAVAALFATGIVTAPAHAQDAGTFRTIVVLLNDYTNFDHAGVRVMGGPVEGVSVIVESSDAPWVAGSSSRVSCLTYALAGEDGLDLEAACNITDSDGDTWFALATREKRNADGGGAGETMMLGGTGKYADITGSCSYTVASLPDNWQTTMMTCDWNTPPVMDRF